MAEWLVGLVMEKVIDRCFTYLKDKVFDGCFEYFNDQVSWQKGMEEKLQRLQDIQPKIKAVISDYNHVEIKDPDLNKWYWELRDAVDEADDVLDDFEYMKHEEQVNKNKRERTAADPNLKNRLEVAVQKLDKVSAEVNCLEGEKQKQEQEQQKLLQTRETGSMPPKVLFGRSKEMDIVKQWVCTETYQSEIDNNDLCRNISLLSVVGHGGMGKTSLLQQVYEDIKMTKEFNVQMWVCVSHNFDAKTIIKNILRSLQKQVSDEEPLEPLQRRLQDEVTSKKFLLVLDDIWEDNKPKWEIVQIWENVLRPLCWGNLGSKILITTRMDSAASNIPMIINRKTFQLEGLKDNECLELFNTYAFGVETPSERLKSIAEDIVKKLSGSPLAAKLIGSSLKSQDEIYWIRFLNTNIGDLEVSQNGFFPILKLSYTFLPKCLQNCFAFCCIFGQDYDFNKDELVRVWIALGFIQCSNIPGETLEDIGRSYFNILVQKSFFDEFYYNEHRAYYKMHDLLHDLAQSVSKQECFRVEYDKESPIPETIRHLYVRFNSLEVLKKIGEFKNLRSLFLSYYEVDYDENFLTVLSKIFEASKRIRLLYIYAPDQKRIPENIGCLTHLRYFNLTCNIVQLPRTINNLFKLRYLSIPSQAYDKIYEIGKLKSLQELEYFKVKNEIGYDIGELKHMNELHRISISQLENIKNAEEVSKAKFYDKRNLKDLSLQWTDSWSNKRRLVDHDLDENVFDSIKPYNNNLKRLRIDSYMGVRSAIWMSNVYLISNLEYIELNCCLEWRTLPPFGQLLFLKSLKLYNMPKVEKIEHDKDCMFPSLKVLHIQKAESLHKWFDTTVAAENRSLLPCLTELRLIDCPKLQELSSSPAKLQNLYLKNIDWKGCHWLPNIRKCFDFEIRNCLNLSRLKGKQKLKANENCELIVDELVINDPSVLLNEPLRSISSLRVLTIEKNNEFVSFPNETELWFLQLSSSLFELEFSKLHSLQFFPFSLESFSSLALLKFKNIPLLKSLPDLPSSLKNLEIEELESLESLPSSLSTISSLTDLTLRNISLLKSMPDLPSSLKNLKIEVLESLQCLPSSLSTISSLTDLTLRNISLLKALPDLPSSLKNLKIEELESLECLPYSLSTISSLTSLTLINIPLLKSLPDLPSSLKEIWLQELESLQCLPSALSTISSLTTLTLCNIPLLKSFPDLPSSLKILKIEELESLQCLPSYLSNISSLTHLTLRNIPLLKSLPDLSSSLKELGLQELESLERLPSSLSTISSLKTLGLENIPLLKSLPDLPSSLNLLGLLELESLECLPSSLSTISSLKALGLKSIPLLKSLPDLPSFLEELALVELESLQCQPSFLSNISSLNFLKLKNIPLLKSLPDLPLSLKHLHLEKLENMDCLPSCLPASLQVLSIENCDPQLMERYPNFDRT